MDGVDLATVPRHIIRERCFITVSQDPFIIPSLSLRFHVDPEEIYSNTQIIEVLKQAYLWPILSQSHSGQQDTPVFSILDSPLNSLPSLSAGQAQLLSLARAILRSQSSPHDHFRDSSKQILLMDEATSSLDPKTERICHDLIDKWFTKRGFTVVMVTHRLGTALKGMGEECGRVVWLEAGKIKKVESPGDAFRRLQSDYGS